MTEDPRLGGLRQRGITFWMVVTVLPWIIVVRAARSPIQDNSFLWHIRAGTIQADAGAVLTADPFSFTFAGRPWRTQSWLADLAYGWLDDRAGLAVTPWMLTVVGAVVLGGVSLAVWRGTASRVAVAATSVLTGLLMAPFLNPRPVLWSFLFLSLLVLIEQDRRLRWALPPLFWVWASVHASFPLGAVYLVLCVLRTREWRRAVREAPFIAAAVLATAHGWAVVETLGAFGGSGSALALMSEWGPPDIVSWSLAGFLVGVMALLAAGAWKHLEPADLWLVLPLLMIGLSSTRFLFPTWILLARVIGRGFAPLGDVRFGMRPLRGGMATLALVVVLPFLLPGRPGLDEERFATRLLAEAGSEHVLHDDVVGGYVAYALWPERRVFVDDRAELYGSFLADFVSARDGRPEWRTLLATWGIEEAVVDARSALAQLLVESGWLQIGSQGDYVLLAKPGFSGRESGPL